MSAKKTKPIVHCSSEKELFFGIKVLFPLIFHFHCKYIITKHDQFYKIVMDEKKGFYFKSAQNIENIFNS